MSNLKLLFLVLISVFVSSCDDEQDYSELIALIEDNNEKWLNRDIENYRFSYFSSPFDCPYADAGPPIEVNVLNGQVFSVYAMFNENILVDNSSGVLISTLFGRLLSQIEHIKGTPTFDSQYGFPTSYEIDPSDDECDGSRAGTFDYKSLDAQDIVQVQYNRTLPDITNEQQNSWSGLDISDYTFTYSSTPIDCPVADAFPPVEITVEDNQVVSRYVPELGIYLDESDDSYNFTINDIFADLQHNTRIIQGEVLFDDNYYFPISYTTNESDEECDGNRVEISSFM